MNARERRARVALTAAGVLAMMAQGCAGADDTATVTYNVVSKSEACDVAYEVSEWSNGFLANVRVTNKGSAVNGWELSWTFPSDQRVTGMWNAASSQSGRSVTARSLSWNGSLGSGATVSFGFNGSFGTSNPIPSDFRLNGRSCGRSGTVPNPSDGGSSGGGGGGGGDVPAGSCDFPSWQAGTSYGVGAVVRYPADGRFYIAEHENPGYDPIISTWFWEPYNCTGGTSGGGDPGGGDTGGGTSDGGSCNYPSWQAGGQYGVGAVVRYPADGRLYVAEHENPGYDPIISTWFWDPYTCSGDTGGGGTTGGGTTGGNTGGSGFTALVTEAQFNAMFPSRNAFYTYQGLVNATASYPAFANTGDTATRKREVAAFLANIGHETGDLVYIEEIARGEYCQPSPGCPCAAGKRYYGRGPIQLSWNYNYCSAGQALGLPLQQDPDMVARNATVAWQTGIWFWMTQTGAGSQTAHNGIVNGSFGETIRTINGALECGGGSAAVASRIERYRRFCQLLGVDPGANLGC